MVLCQFLSTNHSDNYHNCMCKIGNCIYDLIHNTARGGAIHFSFNTISMYNNLFITNVVKRLILFH